MSRQYDQYMENRVDLYGTEYELVEPENVEELMQALTVKNALETYISGLMHDEDSSYYDSKLQDQNEYIQEFVDSLGDFDSKTLAGNIAYLTKKYDMRIGELEEIIGVSVGYLSRTIKENSKKKISIDIVWKIARLFDTDIKSITEKELWVPPTNTQLIGQFIQRLYDDTRDQYFSWELGGGYSVVLESRFAEMGLIKDNGKGPTIYYPDHLNDQMVWILTGDIVYLERFEKNKDLVIIPFKNADAPGEAASGYDFIFVWEDEQGWHWEKAFYTYDDPFGSLRDAAKVLYSYIEASEFDATLSHEVHDLLLKYVKAGRP